MTRLFQYTRLLIVHPWLSIVCKVNVGFNHHEFKFEHRLHLQKLFGKKDDSYITKTLRTCTGQIVCFTFIACISSFYPCTLCEKKILKESDDKDLSKKTGMCQTNLKTVKKLTIFILELLQYQKYEFKHFQSNRRTIGPVRLINTHQLIYTQNIKQKKVWDIHQ